MSTGLQVAFMGVALNGCGFGSQDLLYRRTRSLANAESANKKLETAKAKNKGVQEVRGRRGGGERQSNTCMYIHTHAHTGRGPATVVKCEV